MAAVRQHPEALAALIERERLGLTMPTTTRPSRRCCPARARTSSGPARCWPRAAWMRGVLPVSAAFHSPMVAPARAPFAEGLTRVAFPAGQFTAYSNVSGAPYPSDPDAARELLAEQLVRPVRFSELVLNLYEEGVQTFLEVGPGRSLTGLVGSVAARSATPGALDRWIAWTRRRQLRPRLRACRAGSGRSRCRPDPVGPGPPRERGRPRTGRIPD